ncbi:gamma tubulin complex Spc97/GCP2 subunit Alp4 [Coemansia sp. RSA 552]|nr:gamma tubulin complex Spc97/GCP2 subunit Alp4 [Coemansia sp. RSA 552]
MQRSAREQYGDPDLERENMLAGERRAWRTRADSVTFTPQDSLGRPTHSEAGDSADEMAYFSTKHHQFESSFRSVRRNERAPLAPRLWDMNRSMHVADGRFGAVAETEEEEEEGAAFDNSVELRPLPLHQQELAIIEDTLSLMIGVNGRYISFRYPQSSANWRLPLSVEDALVFPEWFDATLYRMAEKILPLVLMHRRIEYFTATYASQEAGVVNQALCAAINTMLKEYYVMVTTLENLERTSIDTNPYTLQQLWYHLYPQIQRFEQLVVLINEIQKKDLPQVQRRRAEEAPLVDDGYTTVADGKTSARSDLSDGGMPHSDGMAGSDLESDDEYAEPSELFVVRGGYTLNILSNLIKLRGGDSSARGLYELLLTKASVPFLQMLTHWLRTGELEGGESGHSNAEFMVASTTSSAGTKALAAAKPAEAMDSNELGEDIGHLGFISIPELTPEFLRPYSAKIVRTGGYLNTLRKYGVDLRTLDELEADAVAPDASATGLLNPQMLMRQIETAYLRANQALLGILFKDDKMMAYVGAVKRYLLFESSDFLTCFFDLISSNAKSPAKDLNVDELQIRLDTALLNPASVSHGDPLKDIVSVALEPNDLNHMLRDLATTKNATAALGTQPMPSRSQSRESGSASSVMSFGSSLSGEFCLTGGDLLALQLKIPFPFNIVLDKDALDRHKALSRVLLGIKLIEHSLVNSWMVSLKLEDPRANFSGQQGKDAAQQAAPSAQEVKLERLRRSVLIRIHALRHRMLVAIQQIIYYFSWDVIEPQWERMVKLMAAAETVDELHKIHKRHQDLILQQCGLTMSKLPKILIKFLLRIRQFAEYVDNNVSSKKGLFPVARASSSSEATAAGRLLADMHKSTSDRELQYNQLKDLSAKIEQHDVRWTEQLRSLMSALNYYAHQIEVSYLTLAVRLDCNRADDDAPPRR